MTIKETLVCSGCMVTSTPLNHSTQYISGAIRRMISYLVQMHMTAHCTRSLTYSTFADDDVTISSQESPSEPTQDKVGGNPTQPSSSENLGGMRKAARMRFSQEQIQTLEQRFQEQHYLLPADRKLLAHSLGMSERQVKTWFQNKRAQCKRSRILSSPSLQQPLQAHATYSFTWPYSLHPLPPPPLSPLASFSLMQSSIEQRPLLLAQTSLVSSPPPPPSLPLLARQYYASCHAGTH
uniref:Hex n=1 Tax=Amphimedon queenslandica TaxID=400682 RepID=B2M0W9_AMPQE|nr:Hex [Amphimedon queenslandica]